MGICSAEILFISGIAREKKKREETWPGVDDRNWERKKKKRSEAAAGRELFDQERKERGVRPPTDLRPRICDSTIAQEREGGIRRTAF